MATATTVPSAVGNPPLKTRSLRGRGSDPTPTLFPDVPSQRDTGPDALLPPVPVPERVGIARLAFSSPLADAKRGTEYFLLPVKSILNHCESNRVPFSWTVNPYRGCEFGCQYCYARYTHEFMELGAEEFERKIYVKQDCGPLAARDLGMEKVQGEHIAIGTATDPYQPAEREFGVTRSILEQMAARKGLSVSITTKSDQVLRDLDLLRRISAHSGVSVNLSITTLRARLARILEPRAPRPDLRLRAIEELRRAGIAAGVFAMPVLPGITDREEDLDALARAARDAGAQWFAASVLFLMPSAQKQFLPFLDAKFPKLARRYREWYSRAVYAPETYRKEISGRVAALRKKYGLGVRPLDPGRPAESGGQLSLGLEVSAQER
ncbi:MAG TPA: radical SAM protein [Candidatus Acidoferrales bacterium]|nr:radical SAM protein [Candidatus Acidoferrales bacterium]